MKSTQLSLLAMILGVSRIEAKFYKKNVSTFEIDGNITITGSKIEFNDAECDSGFKCLRSLACIGATKPMLTEDEKYFACCAEGQRLLGNPETAFDCCADGHDLAGGKTQGYHCCPSGFDFDGSLCKEVCKNGKVLLGGKCVCPERQVEGSDGQCVQKPKPQPCDSGLQTGKCYMFIAENGNKLGLANNGFYFASPDSMTQRYGKFQLCGNENCSSRDVINPSQQVFIRDMYGDLATGTNSKLWLNNAQNGAHIGRTPQFAAAGRFSISKWPSGKYCLTGFTSGVGPACPAQIPALTFYSQDPQMCVAFEFIEVPCDIKSDDNNCLWHYGSQRSSKIDQGETTDQEDKKDQGK
ncbi:hypothetical protein E4U43_003031 [Claviceps pusilla]|uniref:Cystein rich protein n=1 Tax=Claviceps pusilla TaxID=123648 RepID=A0A9P7N5C6_9HYPO|nr:hypothetical protein E4U43_003031 [Claviceps pusilla]